MTLFAVSRILVFGLVGCTGCARGHGTAQDRRDDALFGRQILFFEFRPGGAGTETFMRSGRDDARRLRVAGPQYFESRAWSEKAAEDSGIGGFVRGASVCPSGRLAALISLQATGETTRRLARPCAEDVTSAGRRVHASAAMFYSGPLTTLWTTNATLTCCLCGSITRQHPATRSPPEGTARCGTTNA